MRVPVVVATGVVVIAGAAAWFLVRSATPPPTPVASRPAAPIVGESAPSARPPAPSEAARVPARRAALAPAAAGPVPAAEAAVEAAPTTATLRVETDVADATVFIDRVGIGSAPITIPNLAPGPHRLNVSATGYESYGDDIELAPGPRTISVVFKEIRLDAKIAAVHKHGLGSCKGQLFASPQGLKYDATDGKDSFSVVLADLDTFELDYLAKLLKVKTRQGKTFNFTDSDGNADRLFAFHRDVDKARKRILSGK